MAEPLLIISEGKSQPAIVMADYPPPPLPMRQYITTQGDMWDLISLRVYGMRRGDDHLIHKLLVPANYSLRNICQFPAGVAVNIPEVITKTEIPLVPWKKAARIQT